MKRQVKRKEVRKLEEQMKKYQAVGPSGMSQEELLEMATRINRLRAFGILPPAKKRPFLKRVKNFIADRLPW